MATHEELLTAKIKTRAAYNEAVRGGASNERIAELHVARWAAHHEYRRATEAPVSQPHRPTVAVEAEVQGDPFEAITKAPMRYFGRCPFRGWPFVPELDDRCPTSVQATAIPVTIRMYDEEATKKDIPNIIPHMVEGEHCWTCVHDQIREQENGVKISTYRGKGTAAVGRGRRTKRAA